MNNDNKQIIIKWIIRVVLILFLIFIICVFRACQRIGNYDSTTPFEDLTFTEKIADIISPNIDFETKEELIEDGIIYNDEMETGSDIMEIIDDIIDYSNTTDKDDIDSKIEFCDKELSKLQKMYDNKKINTSGLEELYSNSYDMIDYYKSRLKAYKELDTYSYKEYIEKYNEAYEDVERSLEKIGFTFKN